MRQAPAFEELLDERLRNQKFDARPVRGPARAGTAAAFGFFFGAPAALTGLPVDTTAHRPDAMVSTGSGFAGAVGLPWAPRASTSSPDPMSPYADRRDAPPEAWTMSARERQALQDLLMLGASLGSGFTFDELRRAFRALARTYHPDRHTESSAAERAHFAQLFARAHDAYRVLARRAAGRC